MASYDMTDDINTLLAAGAAIDVVSGTSWITVRTEYGTDRDVQVLRSGERMEVLGRNDQTAVRQASANARGRSAVANVSTSRSPAAAQAYAHGSSHGVRGEIWDNA